MVHVLTLKFSLHRSYPEEETTIENGVQPICIGNLFASILHLRIHKILQLKLHIVAK